MPRILGKNERHPAAGPPRKRQVPSLQYPRPPFYSVILHSGVSVQHGSCQALKGGTAYLFCLPFRFCVYMRVIFRNFFSLSTVRGEDGPAWPENQ